MRALSEPSRLAAAVFLLLVAATIGAFFAAQRLKQQPPLLRYRESTEAFSPNKDRVQDTARIRFKLPEADEVTVTILDEDGGIVRRVVTNQPYPEGLVELEWDGTTTDGLVAPEDTYSVRVGLRDQGRTNTLKHDIRLDLTPPRPKIRAVDAPRSRPIVIDGASRTAAVAEVAAPARKPRFSVWRTDIRRPRRVVKELPLDGRRRGRWEGDIGVRDAPPGTYMITAAARDAAGNSGSAPGELPPPASGRAAGGVGVVVRPVAITPPLLPVAPGTRARMRIDTGGLPYRWALRRLDGTRARRGRARAARLAVPIPNGPGGAYVLTVRAGGETARAVVPVSAPQPRDVLVVLPALTWQGRNDVDDDGDGLPDSLARERPARIGRPFARGRLPRGFAESEARLLAYLDRQRLRYDVTTDLELARTGGTTLAGHDGVVLAGDTRWLPEALGMRLEEFVRRGGKLFTVGFDSLQRTMTLGARMMSEPSERRARDFLGAELARPVREPTGLAALSDEINLFSGTAGALGGPWDDWQETRDVGRGRLVATAGSDGGETVFVAYRLGRGLVVRPGVAGWSRALDDDISPPATTTRRIWTLVRR
ncbi:MAG TPA: N,N-dimethylformamidase beta subunit family domain-containing protein [Thermoleophilaceae bacterium]|nr:N,N-dimethylformamidase beta subunit family domain-containing protein [Thermoleophilaceae bacterium]